MRYDSPKNARDGRALGRVLADLRGRVESVARPVAGQVPDPTPPAEDMRPGSLSIQALRERS